MEIQVKIEAKLYRCRDTAKSFFKEEYHEKIEPYKELISNVAKENNIEILEAVMMICEDEEVKGSGFIVMLIMAAAVELIEPM